MLEPEGHAVMEAENGRAALARLRERPPSVVLLDLMMPEMDGFEFVAEFRRHEAWRTIPVVVVTAKDLTADDRARLNGYVQKILQKGAHSRERAAGGGARARGDQRRPPEARGPDAKILLVEDNEMNRDMLSRRLVRRGYEVVIAVDGEQGVAMARSEAPALILMDMSLPGLDGWEATRQLKAAPETRGIPVIALTAHAMSGDREKALAAGCDDFDTKPVDLARLLEKIEALLGPARAAREHRPRRAAPPRAAHAAEPHHRLRRDAARGARGRRQARAGRRPHRAPRPTRASSWPC